MHIFHPSLFFCRFFKKNGGFFNSGRCAWLPVREVRHHASCSCRGHEDELKPWMDETGSDFLIRDNASVQVFQGPLLDRLKISGPGFGSVRVNDDGGASARSLDTSILEAGLFKTLRGTSVSSIRATQARRSRAQRRFGRRSHNRMSGSTFAVFADDFRRFDKNGGSTKWMDSKYVCES